MIPSSFRNGGSARLAVATSADATVPGAATLVLLAAFGHLGRSVRYFRSRACLADPDAVVAVTGSPPRHLDAWLMPPELLATTFERGARGAALAVVEGSLETAPAPFDIVGGRQPGPLGPIREALDLPCLAVLDCRRLDRRHLPKLHWAVDAVVLDGLESAEDYAPFVTLVEMILRKPVLGMVVATAAEREAVAAATDTKHVVDRLARRFLANSKVLALQALATSRPRLVVPRATPVGRSQFRVAYAHDEAFGRYFPDNLETLEALGADLVDFSPLTCGELPRDVDLVLFGCGYPDRHAEALAANVSLLADLRSFVYAGNRIYAEGGGLAYLAQEWVVGDRRYAGAGVLPFAAVLASESPTPRPVERTLRRPSWLGPAGTTVRGYISGRWRLESVPFVDDAPSVAGSLVDEDDISFRYRAVGSLVHLHLAALPRLCAAFARPVRSLPRDRARS